MVKYEDSSSKAIETFLSIKTLIVAVIGVFVAGIVSVVTVTTYLDSRADEKYYVRSSGYVLESKVQTIEETLKEQSNKIDILQQQQNQLLVGIGRIEGKLDMSLKNKGM